MRRGVVIVVAALGVSLGARAQDALPAEWQRVEIEPAFPTTALACSGERAYVRGSHRGVRVFDGERWSRIPSPSELGEPARGWSLWVSRSGRVVVDGDRRLHGWGGHEWQVIAVDRWFHSQWTSDRSRLRFAIDGLGESPWVLGWGAVALDANPNDREFLRAYDVASAWYALHDLEVLADDLVFVAGDAGLLRWDGHAWRLEPTRIEGPVTGVRAFAADDIWAWGYSGIAHFDGRSWSPRDEGIELRDESYRTRVHVGGRSGQVFATANDRVYELVGSRWVVALDERHARGMGTAEGFGEICATNRFIAISADEFLLIHR